MIHKLLFKIDYQRVQGYAKNINIFELKKLYIPVNLHKTHWVLVVVDIQERSIIWYDSLSFENVAEKYFDVVTQYLTLEYSKIVGYQSPSAPASIDWTCLQALSYPIQRNIVDCGVYVCMFADLVSDDLPIDDLSDEYMSHLRKHIVLALDNRVLPY